jgi:hypothetical protein
LVNLGGMSNSVRHYLGYGYDLIQGNVLSEPLVLNYDSVREAKCTRLGYEIRLSRLHTLDLPLALAFLMSNPSATLDPEQENNQGTLDKL